MRYCFFFLFFLNSVIAQQSIDDQKIFGVTIDDPWSNISALTDALSNHTVKPTARIVFDQGIKAREYSDAISQIASSCFIMGEILDSFFIKDYSVSQYLDRTTEYLNAFEDIVDIWEIGNEINGEWVSKNNDPNNIPEVIQKIEGAYQIVKDRGKKTALNLYFNRDCSDENPQFEMFNWVNDNISEIMKQGLDYVLVSYYEDDCNNVILSTTEWQVVFDKLHSIFPNSKLGIGECGTQYDTDNVRNSRENNLREIEYINRYYKMNISTPNYIGGYFWWYYKNDCVPKTKELWKTINDTSTSFLNSNNSEFFVAVGGSGDGTFDTPFGSLDDALAVAQSNDIITLRSGTYDPPSGLIETSHLTIQGYQNERPHITKPFGPNSPLNIIQVSFTATHITLKNLELSGGICYVIKFDNDFGYPGATNKAALGGTIEDCIIHHSGTDAIKITPLCDDITIKNCEIYHTGVAFESDENRKIAYEKGCLGRKDEAKNNQGIDNVNGDRMLVQGCSFYDIPGDNPALFFKGGARDCIVERNSFENAYSGIWIGGQTDADFFTTDDNPEYYNNFNGIIRNNIIKDMRGEGIGFFSANSPKVYNNTLIDCGTKQEPESSTPAIRFAIQAFENGGAYFGPPTINGLFVNNVVIRKDAQITPYHDFFIEISPEENLPPLKNGTLQIKNNRYWDALYSDIKVRNNNIPSVISDYETLIEWQTSTLHHSNFAETQSIYADPMIDSNGNPLVDSNCIGAGVVVEGLTEDYYGNPRPNGAIDIGAIQTTSTLANDNFDIQQELIVFNYPNPFKRTTVFSFTILKNEFVKINIYNMVGQKVHTLGGKEFDAGEHTLDFDGTNLASGTYVYKVFLGKRSIAKKMIVLK